MSDNDYTPPKVWKWTMESGGKWAGVNRPIAGATHEQTLPVGDRPMGKRDAAYDLHIVDISEGEQFGSGFVELNPNSKIPVILDQSRSPAQSVFESCSILLYLAEKHGVLLPENAAERTECLSWLFWQESSASFLGGGFGHFYKYAPYPMEYPIDRYTMEVKRQLDVLDRHLARRETICAGGYSIADIAIWPWYGRLAMGRMYDAGEFLDTASYEHVLRWAKQIRNRAAVEQGLAAYR